MTDKVTDNGTVYLITMNANNVTSTYRLSKRGGSSSYYWC